MGKFLLTDLVKEKKSLREHKVVDIDLIDADEKNFYKTDNVEMLKDSIEMFGIMQDVIIRPEADGRYKITAGHRRYKAAKLLVAEGKDKYKKIPCTIEVESDETATDLKRILTNATMREMNDGERMQQARELEDGLKRYKEAGNKLPGRIREIVADILGVSSATVGRLQQVDKNLNEDLKDELKAGKMNMSKAVGLAKLPKEEQKAALAESNQEPPIKKEAEEQKDFVNQTDNEIDEDLGLNNTDEAYNTYGVFKEKYCKRENLVFPKNHKTRATITIAYCPNDKKYRFGINCRTSTSGCCYGPGKNDKPFDTESEAREAAIKAMANWDEKIEKSLISGGYIKKAEEQKNTKQIGEIESETLILPKSHKTRAEIRIGFCPQDGKYRYGISWQTRKQGHYYTPIMHDTPYDTKNAARAAALEEIAAGNEEIKKSLISGGYIEKPVVDKTNRKEMEQQSAADITHQIYAVQSTIDMLQKQVKRTIALKAIDKQERNVEGAANRAALIEYLGDILERVQKDLFDLSGQDVFKGAEE